jgi:multidrug resistance efflux pump
MDIQRDINKKKKKAIRIGVSAGALLLILFATIGLSKLEPAAPSVDRQTLLFDRVKQGDMTVAVRGVGILVSEDMLVIPANVGGRVTRIRVEPGVPVEPDTVIYELNNPTIHLECLDAQSALSSAQSNLRATKAQLHDQLLSKQAILARATADLEDATLRHDVQTKQYEEGLISRLQFTVSQNDVANKEKLLAIQQQQFEVFRDESLPAQQANLEATVTQANSRYELCKNREKSLSVKAGVSGVLAPIQNRIELGQQVSAGQILARITNPKQLKAQLQIPQGQARDLTVGMPAEIDTYNGIISGRVARIEPTVMEGNVLVDIKLEGSLPKGARPDLSVVGTIQIAHLENILYVGRPVMASADSWCELFKVVEDGKHAIRIPVNFGRTSVTTIEVLEGLKLGDEVILSDVSQFDDVDKIRM